MAGFGVSSMGLTPFGLGSPAASVEAPDGPAGSRFIHPVSRDYEIDPTTRQYKQMPRTRQRVMLTLLTEFNSSGVDGFGTKLPKKMGNTFDAECRSAVATALRQMTEVEKAIRLDSVVVERGLGGRARLTVSWTDLVTGEPDRATVG